MRLLIDILFSSAQFPNIVYCINKTRSLMKIFNSKGPSIDPCRTPATAVFVILALCNALFTIFYLDNRTSELMHPLRNRLL